ncbi:MAG TPA: BamA/TamA family outer membrane protein [Polyangiales bacterium]
MARQRSCARWRIAWLALAGSSLSLFGCAAAIPPKRMGVASFKLQGASRMDEQAIKACLASGARPRTGITLGATEEPRCGVPPFDASRLPISLWAWPWTDWPLYDATVFDRDLDRIERWYQARGYYDARVTNVARAQDTAHRTIDLSVTVHEGEPVRVERIDVAGIERLSTHTQARVRAAVTLVLGEPFDEALYDASKRVMVAALREASYARAVVAGEVVIDPLTRRAHVHFEVTPGPACRIGRISISGAGKLPPRPIWGAADLQEGQPFSESALQDAKRAIYALGPFASVEIQEKPRKDRPFVDLLIKVVPGRTVRFGVGVGMLSGTDPTLAGGDPTAVSIAQWDAHLLARAEDRNFLGGMRRLSIEDRPRLIFGNPFPASKPTDIGNLLVVEFRQPAFAEPRTTLVASARWDRGPDPWSGGGLLRSDIVAGVGPQRQFLDGKLTLASALNVNLFIGDHAAHYPDYRVTYFQHSATLDLRDQPRQPRRGSYFAVALQHAGYFLPSDWNYVRITPEARGYLPLPLGMVLAGRVRLGVMEITDSDIRVPAGSDPTGSIQRLRDIGPLRQRLRGGGGNSVRGYAPNALGDVTEVDNRLDSGGLRQWETSLELRIPITANFGSVLFADAGDVTRSKTFRWSAPQTTLGIGLRYKTLVGPLRLDAGFAPSGLQVFGHDDRVRNAFAKDGTPGAFPESTFFGTSGAIHFTIGEAF